MIGRQLGRGDRSEYLAAGSNRAVRELIGAAGAQIGLGGGDLGIRGLRTGLRPAAEARLPGLGEQAADRPLGFG
jgi:hypothetical protein